MKRTTIFVDADLINRIKEISKEEDRSVAEIIREARTIHFILLHLHISTLQRHLFGFVIF